MKKRAPSQSLCAKRIEELEKLADQFWPGKDDQARAVRARNIWAQLNRETDWDIVNVLEPERDPIAATLEEVVDTCLWELVPSVGAEAIGFGDHLRRKLRTYGFDLETLFAAQKFGFENIPWEELLDGTREQEIQAEQDLNTLAEHHFRSAIEETVIESL